MVQPQASPSGRQVSLEGGKRQALRNSSDSAVKGRPQQPLRMPLLVQAPSLPVAQACAKSAS